MNEPFFKPFSAAVSARQAWFEAPHNKAFRLFSGFSEGEKYFSVDVFAKAAVINDYRSHQELQNANPINSIVRILQARLPFVETIVHKHRKGKTADERKGILLFGDQTQTRIVENDIKYAVSITLNRDASFYLDTRNVRHWAKENLAGKTVLNTFSYTGSLGIAAMASGAEVVQTDLNREFLNLAKQSYSMNGFPIEKRNFITGDFFMVMKQLARQKRTFDCVFLDPPLFSSTSGGTVDLENNMLRLINKIRPLVKNGGQIVAINNAIYLSGAQYMTALNQLCADGYVSIDRTIPIAEDCTGYANTIVEKPFVDPAPFNHSTKIVVLNIHHKQ